MTDYATADFFRDEDLLRNPYPCFDYLRGQCPVHSATGPFAPFPVPLEGDDIGGLIDKHRCELPFSDMILSLDPPGHTARRGLPMSLITPRRQLAERPGRRTRVPLPALVRAPRPDRPHA
jgi:cytochrome P450 family 150 subfamily A5